MNFKENESQEKLRGGYYTPARITDYLCKWILSDQPRTILEPSCGDGAFIKAINTNRKYDVKITGIELDKEEARKSEKISNSGAHIIQADFLEWAQEMTAKGTRYDAIIGNPPYIRYQYLSKAAQEKSEAIFKHNNLRFTKHTNAWVPFVIASINLLKEGGRLAMVVPSEIMYVLHATGLREFLLKSCTKVLIIDPNELLFDEALQGTIILLAEKKKDASRPSLGVGIKTGSISEILSVSAEKWWLKTPTLAPAELEGKWTKLFLSPTELATLKRVLRSDKIVRFRDIATVDVGIVTGANRFFLVDDATVRKFQLKKYVKNMFGRSSNSPGVIYSKASLENQKATGASSNFLHIKPEQASKLPAKVRAYIKSGEKEGLHLRYKCRIRTPWFSVPSVYRTDIAMMKRSNHFPKLIFNTAESYTTDTAYRVKVISKDFTPEKLVFSFINSVTALSAELEGRHYGGGVLELVPSEIGKLMIPLCKSADIKALDEAMKSGLSAEVVLKQQDAVILSECGISAADQLTIHNAWLRIRNRRHRNITSSPESAETDDN